MQGRKQKILKDSYRQKARSETCRYDGAHTYVGMTENTLMEVHLLKRILSQSNLELAYRQVKRNGGSYGVDKMDTEALLPYLLVHKESLAASLYSGTYRPNPVRRERY
jgi:retron-type reverse transcriptase